MAHSLEKRVLSAGLIALALAANPQNIHAKNQAAHQVQVFYPRYNNGQSGNQQKYSVRFIESEKNYLVDAQGNIRPITEAAGAGDFPKLQAPLIGTAAELQEHYTRLQNEGAIPNLGHLENILNNIADGMLEDQKYLASNKFTIERGHSDGSRIILVVSKSVRARETEYNFLLNAIGRLVGDVFVLENLMSYQIANSNQFELWQSQSDFERRHAPKMIEGNLIVQQRFPIEGKRVYDPRLERLWETMRTGLAYQQITRANFNPAPTPSR